MSKFFIDRPIFAWVIALVIMLVGALSILKLPINQYPAIAPTAIDIQVTYPGASAQTVQDTVVQVIEQQLNGDYVPGAGSQASPHAPDGDTPNVATTLGLGTLPANAFAAPPVTVVIDEDGRSVENTHEHANVSLRRGAIAIRLKQVGLKQQLSYDKTQSEKCWRLHETRCLPKPVQRSGIHRQRARG